jgi:uncharacterized protein YkwD
MTQPSPHRALSRRRQVAAILAVALLTTLGFAGTAGAGTDDHPQWSAEAQQFVYELNRIRWNPADVEADAGLARGTIAPAPPLAVSDALADAARFRSNEMAEFDYFAHQSPVTGDWPNAVARDYGYPLPAWWPNEANNIESIHRGNPSLLGVLQSFVNSPSHRSHLMGQGWFANHREIGVGTRLDERVWTVLTGTDGSAGAFLTGVVYDDANDNGRMDLGEGLQGVAVTAGTFSTLTNVGGGWTLAVPPGRHRVSASGGSFRGESSAVVRIDQFNIEVDFVSASGRASGGRVQVFAYKTCAGRTPTILGTGDDDVIQGTPGDDVIVGGGGNDTIDGGGGRDFICGGPGNDTLIGGSGYDTLLGGPGVDSCTRGERNLSCETG